MKELSTLEKNMLENYFSIRKNLIALRKEFATYPKGNISKKNCHGYERLYLQWRDGDKVKTKMLYSYEIDDISKDILLREKCKEDIKESERNIKQLEKALGRKLILKYENENFKIGKYENIKSSICHEVKRKGDLKFIYDVLKEQLIWKLYEEENYFAALYYLGMVDYLSRINNIRLCDDFVELRKMRLKEKYFPLGVETLRMALNSDEPKQEALSKAIPEFKRFNIIECEVRDVN